MLHSIINKGDSEGFSDEMRSQVRLFNAISVVSMLSSFFAGLLNFIQQNRLMFISNAILFVFSIAMFFLRKFTHFNATLYTLLTLLTIYFFLNALFFHNSFQYGILMLIAFTVMSVDNRVARGTIIIFQSALLVCYIYFQNISPLIKPLPNYRHCIVVTCVLFAFIGVLEYFKSRQLNYRKNLALVNEQLKTSNKTKERMLSILSHDFNAPVRNLSASLQLLDESVLTQQQFHDVSTKLQTQLQVLSTSLEDVLNWSKMQVSGDTEVAENISVSEIMLQILPLFQDSLLDKNISLQNTIDANIVAYVNADHLKLIFRNLFSNAIKFSNKGGTIYLNATAHEGKITISVTDEGTGINPKILSAIQNEQLKFTSTPGTAKEKGTGLGLMLVREFLHKNNGTLNIDSNVGKGSTVSIVLPEGK